jgi:tRNA dimethylallyltransferase
MGPTASGKTDLAEALAEDLGAQLINADAFQAYRGMDVGTAKPKRRELYRLLDIKNPNQSYGVGEFCALARTILEELWRERRSAVVVGGTGLYIRALCEQYSGLKPEPDAALRNRLQERLSEEGPERLLAELERLDPAAYARIDRRNPVRITRALERAMDYRPSETVEIPPFTRVKLGVSVNNSVLGERIEERTRQMVQNGWVQEVLALVRAGYGPGDPGFRAIGYGELASYLAGATDLEGAIATTIAETRRYAKRQRTWLRSEPGLRQLDPTAAGLLKQAKQAIRSVTAIGD